jgi:hypothetical protein
MQSLKNQSGCISCQVKKSGCWIPEYRVLTKDMIALPGLEENI